MTAVNCLHGHRGAQDRGASTGVEGARSDRHWSLQVAWPVLHLGHAAPSRSRETHHDGRLLTCNSACRRQLLRAFGGFGTEQGRRLTRGRGPAEKMPMSPEGKLLKKPLKTFQNRLQ